MTIRKTLLFKHRSVYEDIIQKHSNFWPYDLFGTATELKLRKYMRFCVSLIHFFLVSGVSSIVTRCVSPIFAKDILLPEDCWIPGKSTLAKNLIYLLEVCFYIESITYMPLFDGLYLVITGNIKSQFVLLQNALESINFKKETEEVSWLKLKEFSQHHKLLLR